MSENDNKDSQAKPNIFGIKNDLPWPKLGRDMSYFKKITSEVSEKGKKNAMIMGFNTFASMGHKGLPKRKNIVITRRNKVELEQYNKTGTIFARSLIDALNMCKDMEEVDQKFVIGGAQIYDQIFDDKNADQVNRLHWTRLAKEVPTDTKVNLNKFKNFVSGFENSFISKTMVDHGDFNYDVAVYSHGNDKPDALGMKRSEEYQYLDLLRRILDEGEERPDRTNTGVFSLFGNSMRFDLSESFPLLTTKKVFHRGITEELLWFLRGDTDGKSLLDKKVNIWEGNGSRQFLDERGLTNNREHDLGPVYGFQWRHFGAVYRGCDQNYDGEGVDQLAQLINDLKVNKYSRRHILSSWNPVALPKMALPPCHVLFQLYVSKDDRLSCSLYQRSADVGLGVPFNIASYAMFVCILAHHLGLKRGEFVHFLGDTHIYSNHKEALREQLERSPFPFPVLDINPKEKRENVWDYQIEDFELKNYQSHGKLKMKMAV